MDALDRGFAELVAQMPQQRRDGLIVTFCLEAIENEEKSKAAGRMVCDEVEFVEVRIIGDSDVRRRPATDEDRQRFAAEYEGFKKKQPQIGTGTPLAQWAHPKMNRARVMEAAAIGIYSLEQLADIQDTYLPRLGPGWRELRQGAKDYLAQAQGSAVTNQLRAENEALSARLKTLEEMLAKQAAALQGGAPVAAVAAPPDDRIAALESLVNALIRNDGTRALASHNSEAEPKRRGRPPGSKNKPKADSQPEG